MKAVAWLHDGALRHWFSESTPAVYVFDEDRLKSDGWSLKRIGFIYECLLELPVEIRRGNPVAEVLNFKEKHGAEQVITVDTPDPHLREQIRLLKAKSIAENPFVELSGTVDLRRFSRYWAKAERALLAAANLER